jgi:hypothetical protein
MALRVIRPLVLAFLILVPFAAAAQTQSPPAAPAAASSEQLLKPEELDALVAPIALYPDTLLAEVLMASTYPLEVVQADRWVNENKKLKGDQLKAAVDKQQWEDSVKALVATPPVLTMMSEKLDWTQKLGDAVLAQQADVMDAIQRLRSKAMANNKLQTTKEQIVTVKQQASKQVIVIEPAEPNTIYVPYYNPAVVYGSWPYPAYPPYYFPAPGYIAAGIIGTGIAFGAGYALGRWASGGNYWGGGMYWGGNNINVNRPVNINNIGNNWQHRVEHRQGVRYNNENVRQRFGNNNLRAGAGQRLDFRGRGGNQVLRPGGERPGGGNLGPASRPSFGGGGQAQRPTAGNRPSTGANRPSAGNRPSPGANRPRRDNAFGNIQSGRAAARQSQRGQASLGNRGGFNRGGGGFGGARGGGGFRGGGGGGFRGGGGRGGRRSDMRLKHGIMLLGRLNDGLGFYRFAYYGSDKAYVGVMAQEVATLVPTAVVHDRDGYLRVLYDRLGLRFETYDHWIALGARIPTVAGVQH